MATKINKIAVLLLLLLPNPIVAMENVLPNATKAAQEAYSSAPDEDRYLITNANRMKDDIVQLYSDGINYKNTSLDYIAQLEKMAQQANFSATKKIIENTINFIRSFNY